MDALASIFAVQEPCASVVQRPDNVNRYSISYNKSANDLTKAKIADLSAKIRSGDASGLIGLYLTCNFDFGAFLVNALKATNVNKLDPNAPQLWLKLQQLYDSIKTTKYNLDIYLYSSDGFSKCIKDFSKTPYPTYEERSSDKIDVYCDRVERDAQNMMAKMRKAQASLKALPQELASINGCYMDILKMVPEYKQFIDLETREQMLRPFQDVTKVLNYLSRHSIAEQFSAEDMPNPLKIHTELNLVDQLDQMKCKVPYIGISRLSCLPCDIIQTYMGYDHRGTHNAVFNWQETVGPFAYIAKAPQKDYGT